MDILCFARAVKFGTRLQTKGIITKISHMTLRDLQCLQLYELRILGPGWVPGSKFHAENP